MRPLDPPLLIEGKDQRKFSSVSIKSYHFVLVGLGEFLGKFEVGGAHHGLLHREVRQ